MEVNRVGHRHIDHHRYHYPLLIVSRLAIATPHPPVRMMGWMRVSTAPLTTTTVGAACTFAVAAGRPLCCSRGGVCRYSSVHGARLETAVAIDGVFTKPPKTITTRMHTYTTHTSVTDVTAARRYVRGPV